MNNKKVIQELNKAMECELAAIVRYLHHSFLVFGFARKPVVELFRSRAQESLDHAIDLGEKITAIGGHPTINISQIMEPGDQTLEEMLKENLEAEKEALRQYKNILKLVQGDVALEFMVSDIIQGEQEHVWELEKYLRKK